MSTPPPVTSATLLRASMGGLRIVWFQALVGGILATLPGAALLVLGFRALGEAGASGSQDPAVLLPGILTLVGAFFLLAVGSAVLRSLVLVREKDFVAGKTRSDGALAAEALVAQTPGMFVVEILSAAIIVLIGGGVLVLLFLALWLILPNLAGDSAESLLTTATTLYLGAIMVIVGSSYLIRTRLVAAPAFLVLHGKGPLTALQASWKLTRRNTLRIFWALFMIEMLTALSLNIFVGPLLAGPSIDSLGPLLESQGQADSPPFALLGILVDIAWGYGLLTFFQNIILGTLLSMLGSRVMAAVLPPAAVGDAQ